jgi:hypothetical protein
VTRHQWVWVLCLSAPALAFGLEAFALAFAVFLIAAQVR